MAEYTQSIREILQMNKLPEESLLNISDVNVIAKRTLFAEAPVNVIDTAYREHFITGFTLHFMNDELGLETLPLWQIALAEKLYNNSDFINGIYGNLDKQLFSNYHITKTETTSSGEETNNNTTNSNTTDAGTVNRTLGGQDSVIGKDTETSNRSKTGYTSTDDTIADESTHQTTGSTESIGESSSTTESTGSDTTNNNVMDIRYDTPQGSLKNLRTPGGDATGKGVGYVNEQTYNYMSAASEHDESNVGNSTSHETVTGNTKDTTSNTINSTDKNDSTKNSNTEYNETNNDSSETSRESTTTYGQTNTETRNLTGTNATTSNGGKTNNNNTSSETTDYTLNFELIHKSESLLNKVWEVFDDLFMYIF